MKAPASQTTLGSDPFLGTGRGIVALVLAYVLLLQSLPLAPLLAHALRHHSAHPCMHTTACICRDGHPCAHHTDAAAHKDVHHEAALQTCGTPAATAFIFLSIDKALLPPPAVWLSEQRPPRRAVGHSDPPFCYRADDVFRPPRAA